MPQIFRNAPRPRRALPGLLPRLLAVALAVALAVTLGLTLWPGQSQAAQGSAAFPDLTLQLSGQNAAALGLASAGPTNLSRLPAQGLLVLLVSYFCPPCHQEMPRIKDLARRIRERGLGERIRIVGVAPGDDAGLVERFSLRHGGLPFALVPDPALEAHKRLGSPAVPILYTVSNSGGRLRVLSTRQGEFNEDPDAFLDSFLRALPPPQGGSKTPARR
jgi:thiol-disulfide isomerase/thioredoxin